LKRDLYPPMNQANEKIQFIDREKIEFYPELGVAAFRRHLADELCCWFLFNTFNGLLGGSGKMSTNGTIEVVSALFGVSRRTIDRKLRSGEGVFWSEGGGNIYPFKTARVMKNLGVRDMTFKTRSVPVVETSGGFSHMRALMLASIATLSEHPITCALLASKCRLSQRTIRNYLGKAGVFTIVERNFKDICAMDGWGPAAEIELGDEVQIDPDGERVHRQLPNTYKWDGERSSGKKRRKKFKREREA